MVVTRAGSSTDSKENKTKREQLYERNTLVKYERRMKEFEIRCFRAAKMNYDLAAGYDSKSFNIQMVSYVFGAGGIATFLNWFYNNVFRPEPSYFNLFLLTLAAVVWLLAYWTRNAFQAFRDRAKDHNEAAAKWQVIQERMRSCRWALEDPNMTMEQHKQEYERLLDQREKIVNIADIPQAKYKDYEDPEKVKILLKEKLQKQKQLFDDLKDAYELSEITETEDPENEVQ